MLRILVPLFLAVVAGAIVAIVRGRRRRGDATPGLHQHPERLNQSLDPTDDA